MVGDVFGPELAMTYTIVRIVRIFRFQYLFIVRSTSSQSSVIELFVLVGSDVGYYRKSRLTPQKDNKR